MLGRACGFRLSRLRCLPCPCFVRQSQHQLVLSESTAPAVAGAFSCHTAENERPQGCVLCDCADKADAPETHQQARHDNEGGKVGIRRPDGSHASAARSGKFSRAAIERACERQFYCHTSNSSGRCGPCMLFCHRLHSQSNCIMAGIGCTIKTSLGADSLRL